MNRINVYLNGGHFLGAIIVNESPGCDSWVKAGDIVGLRNKKEFHRFKILNNPIRTTREVSMMPREPSGHIPDWICLAIQADEIADTDVDVIDVGGKQKNSAQG